MHRLEFGYPRVRPQTLVALYQTRAEAVAALRALVADVWAFEQLPGDPAARPVAITPMDTDETGKRKPDAMAGTYRIDLEDGRHAYARCRPAREGEEGWQ